ncbi:MAG: 4'-phosphopantetheinyl transferase superfamily protein [Paracoccaceae bacterium]
MRVDIWAWALTGDPARQSWFASLLSADETQRAGRFVRPRDRTHFVAARGRLREILSSYAGTAPEALRIDTTAKSKPVLTDGPAFNLSHSGGYAVLAVAPDHTETDLPLGIDIEAPRAVEPQLAELSFSATEQAQIAAHSEPEWTNAFFRCWTRKEAVIKALGTGLYTDLSSFDVTLRADDPVAVTRTGPDLPTPANWRLFHFDMGPGIPGALACITTAQDIDINVCDAPDSVRPVFRF